MFAILVIYLLVARAAEIGLAERNRRWALDQGGKESGQWHYPILAGMHVLFYICFVLEYLYLSKGWNILWPLWLAILIPAQILRVWAIASLGHFWNTRIIVVPGLKPVLRGPYGIIRHPNYLVVATEIFVIPVMCGAYFTALFFSVTNALVLYIRIREEERALDRFGGRDLSRLPRFIPDWRKRRS